jgi:amino acid transporter
MNILPLVLALGIMLSPETLILLGNGIGELGSLFILCLISAFVIHLFTALVYGAVSSYYGGPAPEARFIQESLGSFPALVFPLCARITLAISLSTAILVSSGYVFNEIFVIWFPNLGFSFCLLGILLMMNLLSPKISERTQIFFVAVSFLGLAVLTVVGLVGVESSIHSMRGTEHSSFVSAQVAMLALLPLIGYDLSVLSGHANNRYRPRMLRSMVTAILLIGVLFITWGVVSSYYVSPERLSETSIPHKIAARLIWGQKGRVLLGLAVISGTCCAVNALLISTSRMLIGMAKQNLLPAFVGLKEKRAPVPLLLIALSIAGMMGMGMGGEPLLAVYVRAGFLFWLFLYAIVHLSLLRNTHVKMFTVQIPGYPVINIICLIILCVCFSGLFWLDSQLNLLVKVMLGIFIAFSVISLVTILFNSRKG